MEYKYTLNKLNPNKNEIFELKSIKNKGKEKEEELSYHSEPSHL